MAAAIEGEGLRKEYGETVAVADLSFAVETGEIFGFLGPNGAGKTTTIRALVGFQAPTAGAVRVLGTDVREAEPFREVRRRVGYLPANPALDEDVTGAAFLDHRADLTGERGRLRRRDV